MFVGIFAALAGLFVGVAQAQQSAWGQCGTSLRFFSVDRLTLIASGGNGWYLTLLILRPSLTPSGLDKRRVLVDIIATIRIRGTGT